MGEIRFVGTGETRGYPYPVCKKMVSYVEARCDVKVVLRGNSLLWKILSKSCLTLQLSDMEMSSYIEAY